MITKNLLPNRSLEKAMIDEDWWSFMIDTVSEERVREEMHKIIIIKMKESRNYYYT